MAITEETRPLMMHTTTSHLPIRTRHEKHLGPTRLCYTNPLLGDGNGCTFTGYRTGQLDIVAYFWH